MNRRHFLKLGLFSVAGSALPGAGLANPKQAVTNGNVGMGAAYYIPGNTQKSLYYEGKSIFDHPELMRDMREFDGSPVLLTRVDAQDGSLVRKILPVAGHSVEVHPTVNTGVVNGQNAKTIVAFEPSTLSLQAYLEFESGTRSGGHSEYLPDNQTMIITERKEYTNYSGSKEAHYGSLSIRDNLTLKPLERYSCGGIAPHDINLLEDGKHVAVSNYGSTNWPSGSTGLDRYRVEPCVTIIDVASGKIVERFAPPEPTSEYRHLAATNPARVFVLQNREDHSSAYHDIKSKLDSLYRPTLNKTRQTTGASLPIVQIDFSNSDSTRLLAADPSEMLRGQSIRHDPVHDEVIASFPESDCVVIFSGEDGSLVRVIHTGKDGLLTPRGLALHPDGEHYVVAGDNANIFAYKRGSHVINRDLCVYPRLYRHSHMTAA